MWGVDPTPSSQGAVSPLQWELLARYSRGRRQRLQCTSLACRPVKGLCRWQFVRPFLLIAPYL